MSFDPEAFGAAMGEAIQKAIAPLHAKIAELEKALAGVPVQAGKDGRDGVDGKDGASVTLEDVRPLLEGAIKAMQSEAAQKIDAAVKEIHVPKDGRDGKDGASVTMDDMRPLMDGAIKTVREEAAQAIDAAVKAIPIPKDGKDGKDGERGDKGEGVGVAGAMIDRDGVLLLTLTTGEVKNLGQVVGRDGKDGRDGIDGVGLDSFDLEYLDETHEVRIKASCAGRVKEVRYPAGGIRPGGYWRDGTKAKAGEAWVHDGSLWIAKKDTSGKPTPAGEDWVIAARRGRDGETVVRTVKPDTPVRLGASNG